MNLVWMAAVALFLFGFSEAANATERTWRDATGQYSVKAEFVGLDDEQVSLRKSDGNVIQIPIQTLSSVDRRWLARNTTKQAKSDAGKEVLVSKLASMARPQC